ncbi:unannotated protein [freshwater metagenome]|uniref:Unannotated protein n=1 Tax=freshwater metagenome TaxID=449393 RepID=A0A6J6R0U8_9ZZZZ
MVGRAVFDSEPATTSEVAFAEVDEIAARAGKAGSVALTTTVMARPIWAAVTTNVFVVAPAIGAPPESHW